MQWIFIAAIPIRFQIANKKQESILNFLKGSHTEWGVGEIPPENLRASLFNKYLSNETTVNLIHLAGHFLY